MSLFARTPRTDPQVQFHGWLPFVEAPGAETPVRLARLEVQVVVTGLFAETTQTLTVFNPNRRHLEGTLVFPLPDGAVVCGYALDVGGRLVDGVVVRKEEACRILEAEVRKGVDPGLVEQVQGNVYRTRVYPIPAGGSRTVRLSYVSDLTVAGSEAAYHLPLAHAASLDDVSLRVEVTRSPVTPVVAGGLGKLALSRWEDRWVAEARLAPGAAVDDLQVRLPELPPSFTTVERGEQGTFFCHSAVLPPAAVDGDRWQPRRIGLAWDASGSRTEVESELELIRALLAGWGELTVEALVFRHGPEVDARSFAIAGGGGEELIAWLQEHPSDGGTALAALDLSAAAWPGVEAWLLFSDGLGSVGRGLPATTGARVLTVASSADCDSAVLGHLARVTGGRFVNLLRTPVATACAELGAVPVGLAVAACAGCDRLHVTTAGGRVAVVGRLTGERATLTLGGPGAPAEPVVVEAAAATASSRLVARAWAGHEAAEKAILDGVDDPGLVALGRSFGLVTPGTSLLVLESVEQYLEHDVEPPASLPELRAEFHRWRRQKGEISSEDERRHLEVVLAWWRARVEWWETDFRGRRPELPDGKRMAREVGLGAPMPPPSMAMLSPPPAPLPEAMPLEADEAEMAVREPRASLADAEELVGAAAAEAEGGDVPPPEPPRATITITPWSPDTPYLAALRTAAPDRVESAYLAARADYRRSPAFFLDCGDYLLGAGQRELGLRVLSNILELALDDPALERVYAWRLLQAGELAAAIAVLERVRVRRPEEPQSHRDLALALGDRWQAGGRSEDAVRAMELLWHVVTRPWERFPEIEVIALMELNRLIALAAAAVIAAPAAVDRRLVCLLDLDLRISLAWDADLTDVDLHVLEPTGEHAYYAHSQTAIGGLVSRDVRRGYGPEEYVLRRAAPGAYVVKAHYYGSSQQSVCGPCTVTATVFTDYGRASEQRRTLTLRLDRPSDQVVVGEITMAAGDAPLETVAWRDRFAALRRGMSLDEVAAVVGQPQELRGADAVVLVYRPVAGVEVHVRLEPRLVAVQQVMEGAVLDLL